MNLGTVEKLMFAIQATHSVRWWGLFEKADGPSPFREYLRQQEILAKQVRKRAMRFAWRAIREMRKA